MGVPESNIVLANEPETKFADISNLFWPMGVGKGGRVYWALFSLPAARPHSPRRRGREGPDVNSVSFGDLGSAGAILGAIPAGSDSRGESGSLR